MVILMVTRLTEMAFMLKKKRFKFHVDFEIDYLSSVPFVSGVLFAKVRLLDGGNFTEFSSREEVSQHQVQWKTNHQLTCKMTANPTTGILEPCFCRVSVRKEIKGGKSSQKLGFADVNLCEFAGAGASSRRYLLEGYDSKKRLDNSILKVNISMTLLSGDPCFKAPMSQAVALPINPAIEQLQPENKGATDGETSDGAASNSSGFGSLPRAPARHSASQPSSSDPPTADPATGTGAAGAAGAAGAVKKADRPAQLVDEQCHVRSDSGTSSYSKASEGSGAQTGGHSRQSSYGTPDYVATHTRSASSGSSRSDQSKTSGVRQYTVRKLESATCIERKVDQTRVDADELIDELMKGTDFKAEDETEATGLQLFVGKDGSTLLGSRQSGHQMATRGAFEQVIIDER